MGRRVVVTGLGTVNPLGNNVQDSWRRIRTGENGIGRITRFDVSDFPSKIAGELKDFAPEKVMESKDARRMDRFTQYAMVAGIEAMAQAGLAAGQVKDFAPEKILEGKEARRMDRFTQFATVSSLEALADAGLAPGAADPERFGIILGNGIGGIETLEAQAHRVYDKGPKAMHPLFVPMMISNESAGNVAIRMQAFGPCSVMATACASSNDAIGHAWNMIRDGDADVMIAGGAEAAITQLAVGGFGSMRALSTRNDEPQRASRPFDKDRDGFVIGEGAGMLILEALDHARQRGASIYAEVVGYGMSGDAFHITAPSEDGDGAMRAMAMALRGAGVEPGDVQYINAHGTSTPYNDKLETLAIKRLFGEDAARVAVSSTKSMTGHLLGAAGGFEAGLIALALRHQIMPPTINLETPDPECDLDFVPLTARPAAITHALSNSFGFGGTNAALLMRRFDG